MAHTRLGNEASSGFISQHCFDFMLFSGFTPRLLITDKASSEVKGRMEELILDLHVVLNSANFRELESKKTESTRALIATAMANTDKQNKEGHKQPLMEDKLLSELTLAERTMVLNDASHDVNPPLKNLIRTHNPVSYLSQHPQTGTSLGKLDRMGARLTNLFASRWPTQPHQELETEAT